MQPIDNEVMMKGRGMRFTLSLSGFRRCVRSPLVFWLRVNQMFEVEVLKLVCGTFMRRAYYFMKSRSIITAACLVLVAGGFSEVSRMLPGARRSSGSSCYQFNGQSLRLDDYSKTPANDRHPPCQSTPAPTLLPSTRGHFVAGNVKWG